MLDVFKKDSSLIILSQESSIHPSSILLALPFIYPLEKTDHKDPIPSLLIRWKMFSTP